MQRMTEPDRHNPPWLRGLLNDFHGAAECHPDHCEMLGGHVSGNEHGRYVHRELIDLKVFQEGLEWLSYSDVVVALRAHVS